MMKKIFTIISIVFCACGLERDLQIAPVNVTLTNIDTCQRMDDITHEMKNALQLTWYSEGLKKKYTSFDTIGASYVKGTRIIVFMQR